MAVKITKLTPEQEEELPRFRQRYLDKCAGGRIDRASLETAMADAYAVIGKPAPKLFILDSPAAKGAKQMWEVSIEGRSQAKLLKLDGVPVAKFYAERLTLNDMFRLAAELNSKGWTPNESTRCAARGNTRQKAFAGLRTDDPPRRRAR